LINVSNEPNSFTVTFVANEPASGRSAFTFNNQRDIIVKPKEQSTVNLIFSPKIQQIYTGLLKIENTTMGQIVEY